MKEYIKSVLVELHKTCTVDQYGQVSMFNFKPSLFGDKQDEVQEYCKNNNGILNFQTYGGKFGTYKAFTIEDTQIRNECHLALETNPNYINVMCSW